MTSHFTTLAADHKARLGVSWHWSAVTGIGGLYRAKTAPKGNGAIAMREICALADRLGATLTLGTSIERLKPYYESFGFRRTRDFPMDAHITSFFARQPQEQGR